MQFRFRRLEEPSSGAGEGHDMEMMELESATDRRQPAVPAYHVLEDLYFLNGVKGFFVFARGIDFFLGDVATFRKQV